MRPQGLKRLKRQLALIVIRMLPSVGIVCSFYDGTRCNTAAGRLHIVIILSGLRFIDF